MTTDNYDPAGSLSAYYPSRAGRVLARIWAREKTLHDWADLGAVQFFEGGGSDPTVLTGYATNKLWLRVDEGVTDESATVHYYAGGTQSSLSSWPELDRNGFSAHIGARSGGEFDLAWSTATSGDPGTGMVRGNHATLASITSLAISKTGRQGQDYASRIAAWRSADSVRIYAVGDGSAFVDVVLTSAPSDQTTYYVFTCSVNAASTLVSGSLAGLLHIPTSASQSDEWAIKTDGSVDGADYSAKAWAIGGTGVTNTSGRGAAKEWAIAPEDDPVDGSGYSALHYAAKAAAVAATASAAASAAAASAAAASSQVTAVADKTALQALDTSQTTFAYIGGAPDEGRFIFQSTDLSTKLITATKTTTAVDSAGQTTTTVAGGTGNITLASHGLILGDVVQVSATINGLSANTAYYVIYVDANNFKLATSSANATAGTAISLSGTTNFTFYTCRLTIVGHGLHTGDGVQVTTAVNGFSLNTVYYVNVYDDDTIRLATSLGFAYSNVAKIPTASTNFTVERLLDPRQFVYVIANGDSVDGSDGAWVRAGADSTDQGWDYQSPPARFHRLNDRLLVGKGATYWNGRPETLGGTGSWLFEEGEGAVAMSYLLVNSVIAGVGSADATDSVPYGVLGASRTYPGQIAGGAIGLSGFAKGDATTGTTVAWAAYLDAVKGASANTTAISCEFEVSNLNSTPVAAYTPYSSYVQGRTYGLAIGAGADVNVHPVSYDCSAAINFFNNGAKFETGLVFRENVLTKDATTNYQHAILLPINARVEWYHSDDITSTGRGWSLNSQVDAAASRQSTLVTNAGLGHYNAVGNLLFQVPLVASAVNYIVATPSVTGSAAAIQSAGSDTNVNLGLRTKGTGTVNFQSHGGTVNSFQVSSVASAVNSAYVQPATTGSPVVFGAGGSDTDIGIELTPKGAGAVTIGGTAVYHATGTDVPVTDGGTGSSTARGATANLGTSYLLGCSAVAASVTGTTSKTTLATINIPAGAMGANGYVEIEMVWGYTNSANNKTLSVELGGSTVMNTVSTTTATASNRLRIWNRNSASSQISAATTGGLGAGTGTTTTTINTASSTDITISGTLANSGETLTLDAYSVKLFYKA